MVRPALSDSLRRTAVALGNILPIIISTPDTLLSGVFEIRMTPQRLRIHPRIRVDVLPQIEIAQPILTQLIRERVIEALYDSLAVPIRAVLTVNEAGLVLLNRAAVPVDEVEDALRRLKERNPKITLLILIPEDGGEGDSVYLLVKIANKLGIEEITIKKVKRDDPPIPR